MGGSCDPPLVCRGEGVPYQHMSLWAAEVWHRNDIADVCITTIILNELEGRSCPDCKCNLACWLLPHHLHHQVAKCIEDCNLGSAWVTCLFWCTNEGEWDGRPLWVWPLWTFRRWMWKQKLKRLVGSGLQESMQPFLLLSYLGLKIQEFRGDLCEKGNHITFVSKCMCYCQFLWAKNCVGMNVKNKCQHWQTYRECVFESGLEEVL